MRVLIDVVSVPRGFAISYGNLAYGNYGVCTWVYKGGYSGEAEWINFPHFVTQPKLPEPESLNVYAKSGVIWTYNVELQVRGDVPPGVIAGVFINPANGQGLPLKLVP